MNVACRPINLLYSRTTYIYIISSVLKDNVLDEEELDNVFKQYSVSGKATDIDFTSIVSIGTFVSDNLDRFAAPGLGLRGRLGFRVKGLGVGLRVRVLRAEY